MLISPQVLAASLLFLCDSLVLAFYRHLVGDRWRLGSRKEHADKYYQHILCSRFWQIFMEQRGKNILLSRFLCFYRGVQNISGYTKGSLRQKIALVRQETFLFDGTIRGAHSCFPFLFFFCICLTCRIQITLGLVSSMHPMK